MNDSEWGIDVLQDLMEDSTITEFSVKNPAEDIVIALGAERITAYYRCRK